ncbi:MAG: hypothetical protein IJ250_04530 [Bacteroidales bacterium]|nr:hypothetical protein [Bacteroidales bacterium]
MRKVTVSAMLAALALCSINAQAQKYGNSEQDSVDCLMNNSLYQEFYKQKDYKDAYEPWKQVMEKCPKYHVNTYIRGYNILQGVYKTASSAEEKEKYFNEMLSLFDQRGEHFGEKWNNIARKAQVYETYKPEEYETIYKLYKQAAELGQDKLNQQYCVQYLQATIKYLNAIKASNEQWSDVFDVYDYASETMENSLRDASNALDSVTQLQDEAQMKKLQKEVDNTRNNIQALETFIEPFASCDKIIPIYEGRFNSNPNDLELLKKITTNLERKKCMGSELFFKATENLHKQEPTPRSASLMGQMLLNKDQYSEAVKYLEEAEKTSTDLATKTKSAIALAQALSKTKNYSAAREAARRAVNYDKSYAGKASILIASMYLATAGENAAWAAYDEAARAKTLDPSVAADAQRIMNAAHGRFPKNEDLFFKGVNPGASVGVGGWIGGSATVRAR